MVTWNIDSDGVVYDWHGFMGPYLSEALNMEVDTDTFRQWDLVKALGVSPAVFYTAFDKAVINGCFVMGEAIPGAIEGLKRLLERGDRVRIVTNKLLRGSHKTMVAIQDTVGWYHQQGLADRMEFIFTGSRFGKVDYPADFTVDDKPEPNEWAQRGARNLLLDRPWNQNLPFDARLIRVHDWEEIVALRDRYYG